MAAQEIQQLEQGQPENREIVALDPREQLYPQTFEPVAADRFPGLGPDRRQIVLEKTIAERAIDQEKDPPAGRACDAGRRVGG